MTIKARSAVVAARSIVLAQMYASAISFGAMNSAVAIRRPTTDSFTEGSRAYNKPTMSVIYEGPAGLTPITGSSEYSIGDEPTYYSSVTCRIPLGSAVPRIDDVIECTYSPDPTIHGRMLRVTDVPAGGRIFSCIAMQAVGIAPSKQWS